jgi:hypothetical protein
MQRAPVQQLRPDALVLFARPQLGERARRPQNPDCVRGERPGPLAAVATRWAIALSVVPGLLAAAAIVYAVGTARRMRCTSPGCREPPRHNRIAVGHRTGTAVWLESA